MFKSNFRILLRSLWKKKFFSVLNIAGLAVGIAASLLIFILIRYELSIDRWHSNRERIYRVVCKETYRNGLVDYDGCSPTPLAAALRREFPQAEQVAAVWKIGEAQYSIPADHSSAEKQVKVTDAYFADSALFNTFDFPWLAGDHRTALQEPYTAAITRSLADSWFGHWQNALGRNILYGYDRKPYKITGILEDSPPNTDIPLQVVLSYETFRIWHEKELANPEAWDNFGTQSQCFFLLRKDQTIQSMNAMLPRFVATHFTPLFAHSDTRDSCYFQPLKAMHFDSEFDRYGKRGWAWSELWSMGLIGIFLLAVACINFINLSTAQSLTRAKEVGVRKVLGSSRRELLISFLCETALLVFGALILGYLLALMTEAPLRQLLGKPIHLDVFHSLPTLLFLLTLGVGLTFLSGFYPGVILSGFDPVTAFKRQPQSQTRHGGISLRRGLLILQFAIAQLLIIGTLVVVRQMDYFRNRPMGFDRQAITLISLPWSPDRPQKNARFKSEALQLPGVVSASLCGLPPSTNGNNSGSFTLENHSVPEDFELVRRAADTSYLSVFHIGMVTGRYPYSSDTMKETALNETAVRLLGFKSPSDILGKHITWGGGSPVTVVGVVHDFHNTSLREKIKPVSLFAEGNGYWTMAVRLDPHQIGPTMSRLQKLFIQIYPANFFEAPFFDDTVVDFYNAEAIESTLFKIFAGLSLFIACLGLYGLVSFMTVQKTKEVGIRKVLGASVLHITYLFSKEFTILVGSAFLLSAPIGYYLMQNWLAGYYYHRPLGWEVFAIAILSSIVIAWITVGYKSLKAALANPAKSLRTE